MESKQSTVGKTIPEMKKDVDATAEKNAAELMAATIQRYMRPELVESPNDTVVVAHHDDGGETESIPVIDLARLFDPQKSQQEAALLKSACQDWGFFQVKNHGIPDTLLEKMRNDVEYFFKLPRDEKKKFGQVPAADLDCLGESEYQPLEWCETLDLGPDRDMTTWPTTPANFRESIESYSSEVMRISHLLMQTIAKNLGVDLDKIGDTYFSQSLLMTYYPACPVAHDKILGLSPHSDILSTLTLVWELNHIHGLQIKRHGTWLPIKPHSKALVVNVGDILEILTNGKYQSIEHRVTVNPQHGRMSISAFHFPKFDMSVGPLSKIVGGELRKYKTLTVEEIAKVAFSPKFYAYGKKIREYAMVEKTIPVTDVQALAKKNAGELQAEAIKRYIRPELVESPNDMVVVAHHDDDGESIPMIDLARLLDTQTSQQEAALLNSACEDWGFFQVTNHGIPNTVLEKMRNNLECFFRLPQVEKKKFGQVLPGEEELFHTLEHDDNKTLDWTDSFDLMTQPPRNRDMTAWPTTPVNFRESIESYSCEVVRVAHSLLVTIAKNLGVDPDKFRDRYATIQALAMACYPACPFAHDKVLGLSPHSDVSLLTVVWELNHVQGLQIKRHGAWVPINLHPEALVINVGDILEILTNGKYLSIEHRVTVNPHKERMSISAFHAPKVDTSVAPLSEILARGELKKYKTLKVDEIISVGNKHEGKKAKYDLFSI